MRIYLIITYLFIFSFNIFAQTNIEEYKIIKIDSTENNYVIFLTSNLKETKTIPVLSKDDDNCYSISNYDRNTIYCLFSAKIINLNKNIHTDSVYFLSLNCIENRTMSSAYGYIGYGDYLLEHPNDKFCTAKEIIGLLYTQDIDSINYFSLLLQQKELFDTKMLNIWFNTNSGISYLKWLKEQIDNVKDIFLKNNNDSIVLYKDKKCKVPDIKINIKDYSENGVLKAKMFYQYKQNCFIQIGDDLHSVFGWVKKYKSYKIDYIPKPNSDDDDVGYQYFPARYYNTDFYNCLCPCSEKSPPTMFINPYKYNATNPILVPADFDLQLPIN